MEEPLRKRTKRIEDSPKVETEQRTTRRGVVQMRDNVYQPDVKYSLTSNSINSYDINHNQCQEVDGKYYAIYMNPYTNERLISFLPILTSIRELDNGIYIYVVLSLDDASPEIYFITPFLI